jgi:hypothetical protein
MGSYPRCAPRSGRYGCRQGVVCCLLWLAAVLKRLLEEERQAAAKAQLEEAGKQKDAEEEKLFRYATASEAQLYALPPDTWVAAVDGGYTAAQEPAGSGGGDSSSNSRVVRDSVQKTRCSRLARLRVAGTATRSATIIGS